MSRRHDELAIELLAIDEKRARNEEYGLGVYLRWCEANGMPPFPPSAAAPDYPGASIVLLRFLFAHHGSRLGREAGWSWNYSTGLARVVATAHRRAHHPDPRDRRVVQYLAGLHKDEGRRKGAPTDALTRDQVTAMPDRAEAGVHPVEPRVVRLRGVVAAAEALELDPTLPGSPIQNLPREAFDVRPDAVVITLHDRCQRGDRDHRRCTRRLDAQRQSSFHAALVLALHAAGDAQRPLAPRAEEEPGRKHTTWGALIQRDRQMLCWAWSRAHPATAGTKNGQLRPVAEYRAQIAASFRTPDGAEDRRWWMACLDGWLWLRRRDVAYALCGVITARRHIEMERLTVGHIQDTPTGYRYTLSPHEHKSGLLALRRGRRGKTLTRRIDHLADDVADCTTACPACALRDHLEVRTRGGAADGDPLFAGQHGDVFGIGGANGTIQRLHRLVQDLDAAEDGTVRVIGTRTLRVTGATLAWQADMPPRQIADEVTGHESEHMVMLYVRRHDPFSCDLILSLDGSERPDRAA